jgi:membrane-bound ClpP family serine protease
MIARHAIALIVALAALAVPAPAGAAPQGSGQQQVKFASGTWWGSPGDRVELSYKDQLSTRTITAKVVTIDVAKGIITIEADFDGKTLTRPVFLSNVTAMKTVGAASSAKGAPAPAPAKGAAPAPGTPAAPADPKAAPSSPSQRKPSGKTDAEGYPLDEQGYRIAPKRGVFVLPWAGGVGQTARNEEIDAIAKEADKWGPDQIIVLEVDSPGGLVLEILEISKTLAEVRKRHRVVAWVKKAISAAAVTSMHCDEIYFRTVGSLGAAMMIAGRDSVYGEALDGFRDKIGPVVEEAGRPRAIFEAMVLAKAVLTYTKDPVTGKVEFHDRITGLPGEVVLSDDKDNLTFTASQALDCGFSGGTADSNEELAKLLDLPEWYEISDYGRRKADAWTKLFNECEKDVAYQLERTKIQRAGGELEQLQVQAESLRAIIKWSKRCKECTFSYDIEAIKKNLEQVEKRIGEIRKARNGGGQG